MREFRHAVVVAIVIGLLCLLALPETWAFQQQTAVIIWDERRPLTWADFRGTPDDNSGAVALVITSFTQASWECPGQGRGKLDGGMQASMDSGRSWVKPRARGNAEVLNHEQGHFNITEVFARRTRAFLRGIECARPADVITRELSQGFQQLQNEWQATQAKYDEETDHHNNRAKQREWDDRIRRQLEESKGQ